MKPRVAFQVPNLLRSLVADAALTERELVRRAGAPAARLERYDGQHVVFAPKLMSVDELARGHERAWRAAYSIGSIVRRLSRSRTQLPSRSVAKHASHNCVTCAPESARPIATVGFSNMAFTAF